jgi:Arc/MetJ family transcription regulator
VTIKRKSHNLDEALLRRAKHVLGTTTETDTIHDALRAVLVGEDVVADLEVARTRGIFRRDFVQQMQAERSRTR